MGGLTIDNNFFILKIEKRIKIIAFDLFLSRDFAYFIQYLVLLYPVFVALYRSALEKIPKFFIRFSFRPANVYAKLQDC